LGQIFVVIVKKGTFKIYQAIQPVFNVQLAGAMQAVGLLDATRYHPDLILTMEFKRFVNVVTLVPELSHHKFHARKERTPTLLDQYHVFHVHQGSILISKVVLNVQTAPLVTFNPNQNRQNVRRCQLEQ
ncbi:MAG: hypothetical protein VW270_20215, partial [Candidatus Poseidoniales archaeon]